MVDGFVFEKIFWGEHIPRQTNFVPVLWNHPHPAFYNLLEIDFPSFWLLLGASRSVWESLESILAARKWFWLPLALSVRPCCVPREQICVPGEQICVPGEQFSAPGEQFCVPGEYKNH